MRMTFLLLLLGVVGAEFAPATGGAKTACGKLAEARQQMGQELLDEEPWYPKLVAACEAEGGGKKVPLLAKAFPSKQDIIKYKKGLLAQAAAQKDEVRSQAAAAKEGLLAKVLAKTEEYATMLKAKKEEWVAKKETLLQKGKAPVFI